MWTYYQAGWDLFWDVFLGNQTIRIWFVILVVLPLVYRILVFFYQTYRLKKSGIRAIDGMKGHVFEDYLVLLFKSRGYKVKTTPVAGDFGADLVLTKNGERIVVQAKRYQKNVGVKAVQKVVSALPYYEATEGWVVTNSYYTAPAKRLAAVNNIRLIDRNELITWMISMNEKKKRTDEAGESLVKS